MIVSCPNCSLEQPLDPFCAGCGKQLPKLLAEQKKNTRIKNNRTQNFILASLFFFSLSFYLYYAYQNPGARPFSQASDLPEVKVEMSKDTIKASKYRQKDFAEPLKVQRHAVTAEPEIQAASKSVEKKPVEPEKSQKPFPFAVQEVYLIDTNNCTNGEIEPGPLSNDELAFFLDCSKILFKVGSSETVDLDPNLPFANSVTLNAKGKNISLNIELAFENPDFKTSHVLRLSQTSVRKAGHIGQILVNTSKSAYISTKRPLVKKELLESYAASALFNLSSEDKPAPKGYFLTVYE